MTRSVSHQARGETGPVSKRKAIIRYISIHAIETAALIGVLAVIHSLFAIPVWVLVVIVVASVAKDAVLFPKVWKSYAGIGADVLRELIGQRAVATSNLNPVGFVKVGGEIWRAELEDKLSWASKGEFLRVVGTRGMTLLVEREANNACPRS